MAERLVDPEANAKRIENVEKCFFGSLTQHLMQPNRILVGEGVLTKMCRKKPKPRQFFLFDDILVYGTIVITRKKYNSMHVINMAEVKLQSLDDDVVLKNGWQIISPKKSFSVYAATGQEKVEWMAHINRCVQDLKAKRGITSNATDDSPVWIPDSEANKCMVCHKSEFTVLNRKHHCRKCGRVVCNPCSTKRWLLPSQSTKRQRVCDACYDKLNNVNGPSSEEQHSQFAAQAASAETSDSSSDEDEVAPPTASPTVIGRNDDQQEPQFYKSGPRPASASADADTTNATVNDDVTNNDVTNTSENDPPISDKDPPVSDKDPPVTDKDPPITDKDPPITDENPPITDNDPPITDNDPPITDNNPPLTDKDPLITDNDPPITDNDPPITDNDLPITDNDPPITDNDPSITDNDQ